MTPSPRVLVLGLVLATIAASPASADSRFDRLATTARRLDDLGPFLERYVGSCRDAFTREECQRNVRATRRALEEHVYAATIGERTMQVVRAERNRGGWRFVVTPFIDGGGLALTHGEPHGDALGRPRIEFLVLEGSLPQGMDEMALDSALRTGRLELEVVFRPEGTWKMKRRGEPGFYEGVKARFLAIRLVETRSGAEIAARVY
jgi:hypothetical protein